jgi:acyl carrier protein
VNRTEILTKIENVLSEVLDNEKLQLSENSTADMVEDWDSVNHVRLLVGLERELGIQFETDEVNSVKNVGGLIDVIQQKLH